MFILLSLKLQETKSFKKFNGVNTMFARLPPVLINLRFLPYRRTHVLLYYTRWLFVRHQKDLARNLSSADLVDSDCVAFLFDMWGMQFGKLISCKSSENLWPTPRIRIHDMKHFIIAFLFCFFFVTKIKHFKLCKFLNTSAGCSASIFKAKSIFHSIIQSFNKFFSRFVQYGETETQSHFCDSNIASKFEF